MPMLTIQITDEFRHRYAELPAVVKKKALKQERLFRQNPFHPSLHTEKLEPKNKQVWSFRIDKTYRVIFRFVDGTTVVLLTAGHHKWIYTVGL
jgi:mRNA-degrading endonuclease RelE of RelBE toxin-antitoxin system